jgi:DNA-binding MarR family transcriptional regulator
VGSFQAPTVWVKVGEPVGGVVQAKQVRLRELLGTGLAEGVADRRAVGEQMAVAHALRAAVATITSPSQDSRASSFLTVPRARAVSESVRSFEGDFMVRQPDNTETVSSDADADAPLPFVVGELLQEIVQGLAAAARHSVHAAGFEDVRAVHDCVFRFLQPEGIRLRDIADRAGMSPQSVGEHVDELERLGYVERIPDPGDRRAKLIRPTPRGKAITKAALDGFRKVERDWEGALGARRLAQMRRALEAIRELQSGESP